MNLAIDLDQEADGRWIAEVPDLGGVFVYGMTRDDAILKVKALALRVIAEHASCSEAVVSNTASLQAIEQS